MALQTDTEVFEITDFTTASDWERFINAFEEVLRQWELANRCSKARKGPLKPNELADGQWVERVETLKFSKAYFTVTLYYLKDDDDTSTIDKNELPVAVADMESTTNDFPARAHCIARWYGLREFVIVAPAGQTEAINSEDKCQLLLSSAAIALNNTQSDVPVFVQLNQRQRRQFSGICSSNEVICHYDMIHFARAPGNYGYLSELLSLFKEKLGFSTIDCPTIYVTVRFTHTLNAWPDEWLYQEHPIDAENPAEDVTQAIDIVSYQEPIQELQLSATWPSLSEELIADSPFHSDLDSMHAPKWSLRLKPRDNLQTSINETLIGFYNLANCPAKHHQILGKLIDDLEDKEADMEVRAALDRITNPNLSINLPQLSQVRGKWKWRLPKAISEYLINYIFKAKDATTDNVDANISTLLKDFRAFRSAPYDSLTWRIVLTLAFVNTAYKDLASFAYLWREIISELRKYWEKCLPLTRMDDGIPNQATCLINQKLQMLNCCIQQKIKREALQQDVEKRSTDDETSKSKQSKVRPTTATSTSDNSSEDDDDDEFFDAQEETNADMDEDDEEVLCTKSGTPEGQLKPLDDLKLLGRENEPLYIPITQDPAPMTEDMLQEQANIMFQLGTSSEGAALRAKMQSAGLLSDMQAFKAANPGALLEDFVRWYSPRDYCDLDASGGSSGHHQGLSERMRVPGNMWRDCWDQARPIPVSRQKRLFDYTKEAEKVLHYFTSFTLNDIVTQSMPILIHSSVAQLTRERDVTAQLSDAELPIKTPDIVKCLSSGNYLAAISLVRDAEHKLFQCLSLRRKLSAVVDSTQPGVQLDWLLIKKFVINLVNRPDVEVSGEAINLVKGLFKQSTRLLYEQRTPVGERDADELQKLPILGAPVAKEFILRTKAPRPASYSKQLPQRMYCSISANDFRVAGSFCEDALYS